MHAGPIGRSVRCALLAGVAASGLALAHPPAAPAAAPPAVYTDRSDDAQSAPDVRKVTLTDNGNGTIHVAIDLAPDETLARDGDVQFEIDADRNRSTGSKIGAEFGIFAYSDGIETDHWNGSDWDLIETHPLDATFTGGRLEFTLTPSDFGVSTFDFVVLAFRGNDMDAAPEYGDFTWPQSESKVTIQSIMVPATALFPKVGKRYAFAPPQLKLTTNQVVRADAVDCSLGYRGARLPSVAPCAWVVPKKYRGKRLTLTVRAEYQGATFTVSLPVVPR